MTFKPYNDQDVASVLDGLVNHPDLLNMMSHWRMPVFSRVVPPLARALVRRQLISRFGDINTVRGFQETVAQYVQYLVESSTDEFTSTGLDTLGSDDAYLFISNHRDIAGDSMLLNFALHHAGLNTVNIAVGDNLNQRSFATDIMKLNKSFFVNRTGTSPREIYRALSEVSKYIRETIAQGQSIWIAQSEGRAKDGIDRTDTAVLKMLLLSDRKRPVSDALNDLRLLPVSLAYEFDPCDNAKARELTLKARDGHYEKQPGEDLDSLVTGLTGYKGRVHLDIGAPIVAAEDDVTVVATQLDQAVLSGLRLFPINYWALQQLDADKYVELGGTNVMLGVDVSVYESRLDRCPEEFQTQWLQIYANPVLNVVSTLGAAAAFARD